MTDSNVAQESQVKSASSLAEKQLQTQNLHWTSLTSKEFLQLHQKMTVSAFETALGLRKEEGQNWKGQPSCKHQHMSKSTEI